MHQTHLPEQISSIIPNPEVLVRRPSLQKQKHHRVSSSECASEREMASSMVQGVPSQQPNSNPIPNSHPNPSSRKRALDDAQSSPYFKMRVILKDLRPLFLEVIRAPEFQHTEAARAIQRKMKIIVDLSKQMAMEVPSIVKCNNNGSEPSVVDQPHKSEEFVKLDKEDGLALGTSIVGGSAFGWNFVMFISNKPEYYGRSKESFRAANPKLEAGEA